MSGHHDESTNSSSMSASAAGPVVQNTAGMEFDRRDVLKVKHPRNYNAVAETLEKPKVLGSYTIDQARDFKLNKSKPPFLAQEFLPVDETDGKKTLTVELNLNEGLKDFNRWSGNTEETFHNFLKWIKECVDDDTSQRQVIDETSQRQVIDETSQRQVIDETAQRLNADFVSWKGNFVKVLKTPYDTSSWTFYATEFKGSVYIISQARGDLDIPGVNMEMLEKWGHTFEHFMTGGDPEDRVDANEEHLYVMRTAIGGMSLMYALGVDCADKERFTEDFEDLDAFLLVKMCKDIIADDTARNSFNKFKLFQWWAENQLYGIPRIIVGFRSNDAIVRTLELMETDELPEISGEWDPNVCFNFLVKFLQFVKERVHQVPGDIYKFDHEKMGHIYCTKLNAAEAEKVNFLPSWYTQTLFAEEESDEDSV